MSDSTSQTVGNYIYLFGGYNGSSYTNKIYKAPISNPTNWIDSNITLPFNISRSTSQIIDNNVYLFGGHDGTSTNKIIQIPFSTLE